MRKDDIDLIEKFALEHDVMFQDLKDLYNLCSEIYNSGWCDGSNGFIEGSEE